MIRWPLILSLLAAALPAAAQFKLGMTLSPAQILPMEEVTAVVRVENLTSAPLLFQTTQANARLEFEVRDSRGDLLVPRADVAQPARLVEPSAMLVSTMSFSRAFMLSELDTYSVELVLEWAERRYISKKAFLKVVSGVELATTSVAMLDGTTRTFSLRTISRDKYEHLILRIDDLEGGRCFGVLDLGPCVRTDKPLLKLDGAQNVHVMFQASPVQKFYTVFSANGEYVRGREIDSTRNVVALESKPDGNLELSVKEWVDPRVPPQLAPTPADNLKPPKARSQPPRTQKPRPPSS